jgi:hypothetical protein
MCLPHSCVARSTAQIHGERCLQYLFCCYVVLQRTWHVPLLRCMGYYLARAIFASTVLALSKNISRKVIPKNEMFSTDVMCLDGWQLFDGRYSEKHSGKIPWSS